MNTEDLYRCDQCEKYFPEDQMTATGGDEIYCQKCWPEKVEEAEETTKEIRDILAEERSSYMFKTNMTTCERCGLTGLDPDELSANSKGKMWCNICWEQIEDFKERKKMEN